MKGPANNWQSYPKVPVGRRATVQELHTTAKARKGAKRMAIG
jgi:hypothetical protein